jgi:hypothetical protein
MALFEGLKRQEGSRSNTALVKSGHMSPAEYWILDPKFKDPTMTGVFRDGVLFEYQYGGIGMTEVVIPKGRMVGVTNPTKDFTTKKFVNVMTLPGMANSSNTIGMVPYNITKNWFQEDKFGGNQPSVITLDYVELPYIPSVAPSTVYDASGVLAEEQELSVGLKNPWGAVIGSDLKCGDYVKSTPSGRLTKWDSTKDSAMDVVGQIYAQDFNSEPWGWMKWVMWDDSQKFQDDVYVNKSGAGNLPSDNGYPFDASYGIGSKEMDGYLSQYTTNPTGIPGLHDGSGNYVGYGKNDTVFADMVLGAVPTGTGDDVVLTYQAKDYAGGNLTKLQNGVAVKIDNVAIDPARITIDYVRGLISIKHAAADAGKVVTATYKAFMYGTPTEWDFKGVIGAFRVLLKK